MRSITRRKFLATSAAGAAVATAAGFMGNVRFARADDEIVIASLFDQSGGLDVYGTPMTMCATLAVEEINAAGGLLGKKLRLISYDPQSNMELYAQYAQEAALKEKVAVVQGAITSASREVICPILGENKTMLWYSVIYEGGVCDMNNVVSGATPLQMGDPVVEYGMKNYGKKVYYIGADYNAPQIIGDWGKKYVTENGGEWLAKNLFPLDVTEFGPEISKIQAAKPDFLYTCLVGGAHISFYRQWAAAGMLKKIPMVSFTFGVGNEHKSLKPEECDGIVSAQPYFQELETDANKAFVQRFQDRFGGPDKAPYLNSVGSGSYIGTWFWAEAVKKAGTIEREAVLKALATGMSWDGPSGKLTVDPASMHCIQDVHLAKVEGGSWKVFQTIPQMRPDDVKDRCDLTKNPETAEQFTPQI